MRALCLTWQENTPFLWGTEEDALRANLHSRHIFRGCFFILQDPLGEFISARTSISLTRAQREQTDPKTDMSDENRSIRNPTARENSTTENFSICFWQAVLDEGCGVLVGCDATLLWLLERLPWC